MARVLRPRAEVSCLARPSELFLGMFLSCSSLAHSSALVLCLQCTCHRAQPSPELLMLFQSGLTVD